MTELIGTTFSFAATGAAFLLYGAVLWGIHRRLLKAYANKPAEQYRRQLIMLGLSLFGLVFVIVIIPVGDAMQGQLLGLLGIVLSATIALSSTTLVGNAMAGLMLKSLRKIRPGNYIKVGEHAGRVSEADLLHTEIQTEDRDLTTLPNLYLVTHPVTVLRDSGTILSVEVSLGYDVPRRKVEELLLRAAEKSELKNPFVQIRQLGDFAVTYRIAALCEDVERLLAHRRTLRAMTLDELHDGGIEIVSPNYMTTRTLEPDARVMPPAQPRDTVDSVDEQPDDVVFDKAHKAESLSKLRDEHDALRQSIVEREEALNKAADPESPGSQTAERKLERDRRRLASLEQRIAAAEERIDDD